MVTPLPHWLDMCIVVVVVVVVCRHNKSLLKGQKRIEK